MHPLEKQIREREPNLGMSLNPACCSGWVNTMCEAYERGEGYQLSHNAVGSLLHTLIGAKIREERLGGDSE